MSPHYKILSGVNDFVRRLQWRFALQHNRLASFSRFKTPLSNRWPPRDLVPRYIQDLSSIILSSSASLLKKKHTCHTHQNLNPQEQAELDTLSNLNSISIKPADKGGRWCIVPLEAYKAEALRQLNNTDFYEKCFHSKSRFLLQRITQLLDHLHSRRFITAKEKRILLPPAQPCQRRFYLLPKTHKDHWPSPSMPPGRPIVSDIGSVSRNTAQLIEFFLAPIAQSLPSFVRDSLHVIALLRNSFLNDNSILFTLDIESLYTNVPITGGIRAVSEAFLRHHDPKRPDLTVLTLLRLLLENNEFLFDNQLYLQKHGVSMGSVFGGSYASIFVGQWEANAIVAFPLKPRLWVRFLDDIFGVWDHSHEDFLAFTSHLNTFDNNIKITSNCSTRSVRFLDLEISKAGHEFAYSVAFKPTDSHFILPPDSYHPSHVTRSVLFSQVLRWATHCSTRDSFRAAVRLVTPSWKRHGHSYTAIRSTIRKVLRYTNQHDHWDTGFFLCRRPSCSVCIHGLQAHHVKDSKSSNMYPIIQHITCDSANTIYLLTCSTCSLRYVGETSRPLRMRFDEHLRNISNSSDTSVARHFYLHSCNPENLQVFGIEMCPNPARRRSKEKMWIKRLHTNHPLGLNQTSLALESDHPVTVVLPYSACSNRVVNLCRSICNNIARVRPAFSKHRNLRSLLDKKV